MLFLSGRYISTQKNIINTFLVLSFTLAVILLGLPLTGSGFSIKKAEYLQCRVPDTYPLPYRDQSGIALSKGKFLVASRNMNDLRFREAVILLIEYNANGAVGLIINRPTTIKLSSLFPDMEGMKNRLDTVYVGGPVEYNKIFLLIKSDTRAEQSSHVFDDIYVGLSRDILQKMTDDADIGKRFRLYAGYAGWGPRQLDTEILRGGWHVFQADSTTIFDKDPSDIWPELIRRATAQWVKFTFDQAGKQS